MRVKTLSLIAVFALLTLALAAQQPAGLQVAQAQLGTGVENRQLTGAATSFPAGSQVYLWLEVTGGANQSVTVTWKHGDQTHAASLAIGADHWRTWATKTVTAGDWTVSVAGPDGKELKSLSFTVQ